ncbi:predicted protein [Scheffersomyces stipitis CBS 6054]|uniref:EXS domain-containing protein n=1 Tax=Scheffersomyces stipitis (strain ATCC 58785 / CBS 6054 / NBRC 10063 / NRRL Y-11545) TaxID=322104 RepID=A3LWV4_PICST|nr:predicted protein [Scheffersomyces stipitis CBS 6054]ABN67345.2 predicted protein [Scheffersomyces stipitis CBS 6054]KAG2732622.1 hypothetical protein G9P44_005039 [Scheffersomyces stipitis]
MDQNQKKSDEILFDDLVPLPFRILFLVQLGVFFWYYLVYSCYNLRKLNILHLIKLSYSAHDYSQLDDHYIPNGEFATTLVPDFNSNLILANGIWANLRPVTIVNVIGWAVFKIIQRKVSSNDDVSPAIFIPLSYVIPLALFFHLFYRLFYKSKVQNSMGQYRAFTTMKRILLGKINSSTMRTNDILISDSLVSYSKVLNDFGLYLWNYYYARDIPYSVELEFILLCIPTFIRMKQCYSEYRSTANRQHLFNFIKYSTTLGPLFVNSLIKSIITSPGKDLNEPAFLDKLQSLNRWWYLLSFVNSTYSFIWDVKMDWGLKMFDFLFESKTYYFKMVLLRPKLAFEPVVYFAVILFDFIVRFVWILKVFIVKEGQDQVKWTTLHMLSTFLFGYDAFSFGYTVIEFLEILRRWAWCFIKLDSDWATLEQATGNDIELVNTSKLG